MSLSTESSSADQHPLAPYISGQDRYIRFAEDILQLDVADTQKEILRTVTNNKNTVVCSGNGVGKSYAVAVLCIAFLYANPEGSVMITSGSYQQLESTVWSEMKSLLKRTRDRGVPLGGTMKESPPRIEFDEYPSKSFRALSTSRPDALEGRHASEYLIIVDEADKVSVDRRVIESARSSVTDDNDRFLVIGNPPRSEANSMYELMENDAFELVNFSSFDSHNVRLGAGQLDADADTIPGLVDLEQVREDYKLWHGEEFPGLETATEQVAPDEHGILHPTVDGLDERWVRRRLGAVPDDSTTAVRPFVYEDVANAEERWSDTTEPDSYEAFGVDIARGGGDRTVAIGVTDERADVLLDVEAPGNHRTNKRLIRDALGATSAPVIIDAVGEGSGVADDLATEYDVTRFKSGSNAREQSKYYDKRAESLGKLGEWLDTGAIEPESDVATELRAASRHIQFQEKTTRNQQAWTATSKSELKKADRMGRSPDLLDGLSLAVWGKVHEAATSDAAFGFY